MYAVQKSPLNGLWKVFEAHHVVGEYPRRADAYAVMHKVNGTKPTVRVFGKRYKVFETWTGKRPWFVVDMTTRAVVARFENRMLARTAAKYYEEEAKVEATG